MSQTFVKGQAPRVSAEFYNFSGVLTDPSAIRVVTRGPDITGEVAYVFGVDAEVVKDATGLYHFDYPLTAEGTYYVRFTGTGTVADAFEEKLEVRSYFEGS